jgi:dTDP-4-dehydrorhamnose reductase
MILVTGGNGQLANCLKDLYSTGEAVFVSKKELDITNLEQIESYIINNKPTVIINTAAFTAVDLCESEKDSAYAVNTIGPKNLAILSKKYDFNLVHISTDYVFDGEGNTPYKESYEVNPQSEYGRSKFEGEKEVLNHSDRAIIIRTSWLYSEYNKNFVKNILTHMKNKDELGIVYDQVGSPTYAADLAKVIKDIIPKLENNFGIYHYANLGVTSWYDLTMEIQNIKKVDCRINPIETYEYPLPAKRPHYSVFNTNKIRKTFNITIPHWKESLKLCLQNL